MVLEGTTAADCEPSVRVFVGETEVPWVNNDDGDGGVETQIRKTGPSDITRFSEVSIPFEWYGDDVITEITTPERLTDPTDLRSFDNAPVRIDVRDTVTDGYETVHHGPIASVGSAEFDGAFKLHVTDWANYLDGISADIDLNDPQLWAVFKYVTDRAEEEHGGVPELGVRLDVEENQGGALNDDDGFNYRYDEWVLPESESFNEYEHSLADVATWASSVRNGRWYVEWDEDRQQPFIVYHSDPTSLSFEGLSLADEEVPRPSARILNNNALYQISPQHTIGVHGRKKKGIFGQRTMPRVIVEHERLADRAGTNSAPRFQEANTTTLESTEREAKSRLKRMIDGAAGGEIVCQPFGLATPYATIDARPSCGDRIVRNVEKITYEIEEVIHDMTAPTQQNDGPTTLLRCGVEVSDDDLNVRESRMVDL